MWSVTLASDLGKFPVVFILLANRCQPDFLCWGPVSTCACYGGTDDVYLWELGGPQDQRRDTLLGSYTRRLRLLHPDTVHCCSIYRSLLSQIFNAVHICLHTGVEVL